MGNRNYPQPVPTARSFIIHNTFIIHGNTSIVYWLYTSKSMLHIQSMLHIEFSNSICKEI